jgi:hypothetical protein
MPETPIDDPQAGQPSPAVPRRGAVPRALIVLAGAVALVAIAFIALGSSSNQALDPVAQAATASANSPGVSVRMAMQIASPSQSTPITASGSGSFDTRDHKGSMSLTFNSPQGSQTMEEVLDGPIIYVKLPASLTGSLPLGGKPWVSVDLTKLSGIPGASSLTGASSDPTQMLGFLRAVSDSVVAQGTARVNGVRTTHYRAQVDLNRVAAAVPASQRALAQTAVATLESTTKVQQFPAEVWVDRNHLVRRMVMTISPTLPSGQVLTESFTIDFLHYGPQPQPKPPPSDQVTNLNGLLGSGG